MNHEYISDNITALYARLSQEDALDGESNSIACCPARYHYFLMGVWLRSSPIGSNCVPMGLDLCMIKHLLTRILKTTWTKVAEDPKVVTWSYVGQRPPLEPEQGC